LRRPRFALSSAFAALGLMAGIAPAQQSSRAPSTGTSPSASADPVDPMMVSRPARYSLRNGMDYLAYREYDRALGFFRSIEGRQDELSPAEQLQLKKGIARAQEGKREAINGNRSVASTRPRAVTQAGGFALAKPAAATDGIQLTGAVQPPAGPAQAPAPVVAPAPVAIQTPALAPSPLPEPAPIPVPAVPAEVVAAPAPLPEPSTTSDGPVPITLPPPTHLAAAPGESREAVFGTQPAMPSPVPADGLDLPALPAPAASPAAEPAPGPVETPAQSPAPAQATLEPSPSPASTLELPALPASAPEADPSTSPAQATAPSAGEPAAAPLPQLPRPDEPAPRPAPGPNDSPPAQPAAEPPPAAEAPPAADASSMPNPAVSGEEMTPTNPRSASILSRRHREEIERIAQRVGSAAPGEPGGTQPADPNAGAAPTQGSTRLELIRAPSPTEARPLRRIPVPEEFVPLGPREWNPNRKYWAPAGTCHMILYFQDPVLERYGQGVEQSLGPIGRYFSYPLDDPRQSNQRNQILQPFYSIGKFCFQVGTLPYKLVVDPPWEAEYDLGYYRPGDVIPPDTIMITPTGVGPPLKGRKY